MDFSDEHYVKMFPRRTLTWRRWPWQAKSLLWPLISELDKAGIVDVGTRDAPHVSIATLTELPADVVKVGLEAFLADGTFELHGGRLVMPNFVRAQESRKTRAAIAKDHREKMKDLARANAAGLLEHPVTSRDHAEPRVTGGDPPSQSPTPTPARPRPLPDPDPRSGSGRTPSWQQDAHAQFLRLRAARLAELDLDHVPDADHDVAYLNTKLKPVLEALGGPDAPDIEVRFSKLVSAWLDKPSPAKAEPPYPFRMFSSPKVWPELLQKLRGAA